MVLLNKEKVQRKLQMNIKKLQRLISIILFFNFWIMPIKVQASEIEILKQKTKEKAIVFLLDASGSMKNNDPNRLAIDSIAQLIYSLPSNYTTGLVAYNTEVTATQLVKQEERHMLMKVADTITYQGYTNAGAGLKKAMELLQAQEIEEKTIVILSDGEILMKTEQDTQTSIHQFEQALEQAKMTNVKIHVIGLGEEMEDSNTFSASITTGGQQYYVPYAADIQEAIDDIINTRLQIKRTTAALLEADGTTEHLTIELPEHVGKARILLTSNAIIKNLKTDLYAENAKQYNGERYSLIEITRPSNSEVTVSFEGQKGNQVKAEVITEYYVQPQVTITYTDALPTDSNASTYDRTAHLTINFQDAENINIPILTDSLFDYKNILISINGVTQEYFLSNGQFMLDYPVEKEEMLQIQLDYSNLPTNILSGTILETRVQQAPNLPLPDPEPDYTLVYIVIAGSILIVFIILIVILIYRKKKQVISLPAPEEISPPPSKYSYTGRINIYITKTKYDYDIPPLSFNLFRVPSNRVLSLQNILEDCNVEEILDGANRIFFKSGANQNLVITNNSDCTIMKNREILMKGRSYTLSFNAKLDITFEDEYSEMMLQYKNDKI